MHTHDGRVWVVGRYTGYRSMGGCIPMTAGCGWLVGTLGTDLWVDVYRVWVVVRYTGYRSMGGCIPMTAGCGWLLGTLGTDLWVDAYP